MACETHAQLKAAGCSDDHCDRVTKCCNASTAGGTILMLILTLAQKYGPAIVEDILAILNPPAPAS